MLSIPRTMLSNKVLKEGLETRGADIISSIYCIMSLAMFTPSIGSKTRSQVGRNGVTMFLCGIILSIVSIKKIITTFPSMPY